MKNKIDKFLERFISKKLTVFIIACVFLSTQKILPENWVEISYVYIAGQSLIDIMKAFRK